MVQELIRQEKWREGGRGREGGGEERGGRGREGGGDGKGRGTY